MKFSARIFSPTKSYGNAPAPITIPTDLATSTTSYFSTAKPIPAHSFKHILRTTKNTYKSASEMRKKKRVDAIGSIPRLPPDLGLLVSSTESSELLHRELIGDTAKKPLTN